MHIPKPSPMVALSTFMLTIGVLFSLGLAALHVLPPSVPIALFRKCALCLISAGASSRGRPKTRIRIHRTTINMVTS